MCMRGRDRYWRRRRARFAGGMFIFLVPMFLLFAMGVGSLASHVSTGSPPCDDTVSVLPLVAMLTLPMAARFVSVWLPSGRSVAPLLIEVLELADQRSSPVIRSVPLLTVVLPVNVEVLAVAVVMLRVPALLPLSATLPVPVREPL